MLVKTYNNNHSELKKNFLAFTPTNPYAKHFTTPNATANDYNQLTFTEQLPYARSALRVGFLLILARNFLR